MRTIKLCGLFCLSIVLVTGCQSPEATVELTRAECPIINGVPDTSEEHMAVVALLMITDNGAWRCSGTLITPKVVLTACHCVQDREGNIIEPEEATVSFGNNVDGAMTDRYVSEVHPHPGFYFGSPYPNDIALLVLSSDAPGWVTPIPHLPAALAITPDEVGIEVEYVGFGLDEDGNSGRKLKITGTIEVTCDGAGCPAGLAPHVFCAQQQDGGTCSGDSGGPAFLFRDEVEYVAGITSYGDWRCSYYGCSTKVDGHASFIDDVVGTEKQVGENCIDPSQCLSGFCVDGYCCISACTEDCNACNVDKNEGQCLPAPDGHPCPDADPCNGTETCLAQVCTPAEEPLVCTTAHPCRTASCQVGVGCVYDPITDGTVCDNFNLCDGDDQCQAGNCVATGDNLDCDDGNVCTTDSCDAALGCLNSPVEDNTSCGDADACNGEETCQAGVCVTSDALDCDDLNACTTDTCDAAGGCQHSTLPEGEKCGDGRTCQGGLCLPGGDGGGCASAGSPGSQLALVWMMLCVIVLRQRKRPLE